MSKHNIVTDLANSFFTNNTISISKEQPSSGDWVKNDIVISSSLNNNIFGWICTKSGNPGSWMILKSYEELTGDITTHNHDNRYFTKNEINVLLDNIAKLEHNHDDRYFTQDYITSNYYNKEYLDVVLNKIAIADHWHSWDSIRNKPSTFPPITGTSSTTAFRGDYGNIAYNHSQSIHAPSNAQKNSDITKAEIEAKLVGTITSHDHADTYYNKTEIDKLVSNMASLSHNHNTLYYKKTEIDAKISVQTNRKLHLKDTDPGAVGAGHIWIKTA